MADNVSITQGSGTTISTDEKNFGAGPVQVQHVAIIDATNDSTNRLVVDAAGNMQVKVTGVRTALNAGTISVASSTVTKIPTTPLSGRVALVINNDSDTDMRVGHSGITTASGLLLRSGFSVSLDVGALDVYVVHAAGVAKTVSYLEIA